MLDDTDVEAHNLESDADRNARHRQENQAMIEDSKRLGLSSFTKHPDYWKLGDRQRAEWSVIAAEHVAAQREADALQRHSLKEDRKAKEARAAAEKWERSLERRHTA